MIVQIPDANARLTIDDAGQLLGDRRRPRVPRWHIDAGEIGIRTQVHREVRRIQSRIEDEHQIFVGSGLVVDSSGDFT